MFTIFSAISTCITDQWPRCPWRWQHGSAWRRWEKTQVRIPGADNAGHLVTSRKNARLGLGIRFGDRYGFWALYGLGCLFLKRWHWHGPVSYFIWTDWRTAMICVASCSAFNTSIQARNCDSCSYENWFDEIFPMTVFPTTRRFRRQARLCKSFFGNKPGCAKVFPTTDHLCERGATLQTTVWRCIY